jgi:hypothetical protein
MILTTKQIVSLLKIAGTLFIILSIISALKSNNFNFLFTSLLWINSLGYVYLKEK